MMRALACIGIAALAAGGAFPQSTESRPKFEVADVHVSPQTVNRFTRGGALHGGRYEFKNASMLDLVSSAYGVEGDKVLGGPTWLEMDRFDVIAKASAGSSPETLNLMLQSLLADRFNLTIHQESKPMPAIFADSGETPATQGIRWLGRDRVQALGPNSARRAFA